MLTDARGRNACVLRARVGRVLLVAAATTASSAVVACTSILGDFAQSADGGASDASAPTAHPDAAKPAGDATIPTPADAGAEDAATPPGDAAGSLVISPASHDFLSVQVGSSSSAQESSRTVTNSGAVGSGNVSVAVSPATGTAATEFPVTDSCSGSSLPPNGKCTLSVVLSPASRGAKSASLLVVSASAGQASASLTGTATVPATLTIAPTSYGFGTSAAGAAGAKEDFVVSNEGDGTSGTIGTALMSDPGTASTEFAIASDACRGQTLAAGQACKVTVQFDPATYGAKAATLAINGGTVAATLTGTGQDLVQLTVTETGNGTGTVTDTAGLIRCNPTCAASYPRSTGNPSVTLTATPDGTSTFGGWGGACAGSGSCVVTLSSPTTAVNAAFTCTVCGTACVNVQSDPANCGRCGHSCLGGACTNGACGAFDYYVPSGASPERVAADGSYVYWVNNVQGSYGGVEACALAGSACASAVDFIAPTPNATSGLPGAFGIAEGGSVLAAAAGGISDGMSWGGTRVESCALVSGTAPSTCAPTVEISNGGGTGGDYAQVATDGVSIAAYNNLGILLFPVTQPTEASGNAAQPYVPGGDDYVGGVAFGTTAGAGFLYWSVAENYGTAGGDSHKIFRCLLGGAPPNPCGAPQLVYDGGSTNKNPGPLVFDPGAQVLYWLDQGSTPFPPPSATDGKLLSCNVGTLPCTPTVLAATLPGPLALSQDANAIYFVTGGNDEIQSCAKAGCGQIPTVLASGEFEVSFLSADPLTTGGSVFWSTYAAVRRLAKP